ncbi:TlpA disulfide reductase family protein [Novosphingobium sp. KACC 22771]|uniref:TlpA disulfide reductase family protein n=1 Tax=Novosphingobium sp. KACC 22771 TaxID=3025670 RepID=UPI002365549D|nr:TlpA disulfide reductase family protein [Novosphingobium sp. KACC 22771]WDF70918.1 TlpA disulfide reductase family protein [Novosphingobium sp. KACC 22771]
MSAPTIPARIDGHRPSLFKPSVIILWATWCGSCVAELRRIPRLQQVAGHLRIATLAMDPPERARVVLEREGIDTANAFADSGQPRAVLAKWGGIMLPLAVAVDGHGQICGRKRGLLGIDDIKRWALSCSK